MNTKTHHQRAEDIFRRAVDDQPVPEGPHPVEDIELLTCWSADLLPPGEKEKITKHLATCPYCRQELADMIESGMLDTAASEPPASEPAASESAALPGSKARSQPWYRAGWVPMVVAASLLFIVGVFYWGAYRRSPESRLARAERDLEAGRPVEALKTAEGVLSEEAGASDAVQRRARKLLEEAGYQVGISALQAEEFGEVLALQERVTERSGASGRMLNLRLQAQRGVSAPYSLDQQGALLDYGYQPDGVLAGIKAFTPYDTTTKRLMRQFEKAVSAHPDSVPLRLNYGQFLLEHLDVAGTEKQFRSALKLDSRNPEVHLGLGLVVFEQKSYEDALTHFQQVLELDPNRVDGHINVAICLERLGRPDQARTHWQQALERASEPEVRDRIQHHLEKSAA